jgi:superfamily II DNA/RNA helicase
MVQTCTAKNVLIPSMLMDSISLPYRFDECPLSPLTLKGVKAAGYERMTAVQEATLPIILQGSFQYSLLYVWYLRIYFMI